jgi:hypothetical protein
MEGRDYLTLWPLNPKIFPGIYKDLNGSQTSSKYVG